MRSISNIDIISAFVAFADLDTFYLFYQGVLERLFHCFHNLQSRPVIVDCAK